MEFIVPDSQDTEEQVEEKVNVYQVFITDLDITMLPGDQHCPNCKCILICHDASTPSTSYKYTMVWGIPSMTSMVYTDLVKHFVPLSASIKLAFDPPS